MGLDSGGTEQLWAPEVLLDILRVMKVNEPFSRVDPASPIFDELQVLHPNITWINTNRDGSLRTAFRKNNPIVKLGLTTPETENAVLTELGADVLSENLSIRDVFAIAAHTHIERDESETKSLSIMCEAALLMPRHDFTVEDVEFGVSKLDDLNLEALQEKLSAIRQSRLKVSDETRKRRIRTSVLQMLVRAGALAKTDLGWRLHDAKQAEAIAMKPTFQSTEPDDITLVDDLDATSGNPFRNVKIGNRQRAPFDLSNSGKVDPVKAAIALERSSQLHEDIVAALGKELVKYNLDAYEDPDSFDLAIFDKICSIFEVKTVTTKNVISQVRKAVVQLEEYRWKHIDYFGTTPILFIVVDQNPTKLLDEVYFDFLEQDRGMKVIWPELTFVDRHGVTLQDLLAPVG